MCVMAHWIMSHVTAANRLETGLDWAVLICCLFINVSRWIELLFVYWDVKWIGLSGWDAHTPHQWFSTMWHKSPKACGFYFHSVSPPGDWFPILKVLISESVLVELLCPAHRNACACGRTGSSADYFVLKKSCFVTFFQSCKCSVDSLKLPF